jgi:oligopeptide/dipeptide ABC transporter ATP-binding protein
MERPDRLRTIEGNIPSPASLPPGCRFHPRCPDALDPCRHQPQALLPLAGGRAARCWRAADA